MFRWWRHQTDQNHEKIAKPLTFFHHFTLSIFTSWTLGVKKIKIKTRTCWYWRSGKVSWRQWNKQHPLACFYSRTGLMTKTWKLLYQPCLGNSWGRLLFLHQLVNIACDLETVCGKVSSCPGSPQGLADLKASTEWFDRAITSPTSARVKLIKYLKRKNNKQQKPKQGYCTTCSGQEMRTLESI